MRTLSRSILQLILALLFVVGVPKTSAQDSYSNTTVRDSDTSYAVQWMRLLYDRVEGEARNVPQAARIYGYNSVALYEALRGGFPHLPSLVGRLNALDALPQPEPGQSYDWITVMNGALRHLIPAVMAPLDSMGRTDTLTSFNTAESNATLRAVDALSASQFGERLQTVESEIVERSFAYGTVLGDAIAEWAADDGFAETRERTAAYIPPLGDGFWVATTLGQHAMEPLWGTLRPFAMENAADCAIPLDVSYEDDVDSTFHSQALEVRDMQANLTDDERVIAAFWDERVGESGTASGHWIFVINELQDDLDLSLEDAASMYAHVGVVMADAFISTWHLKYQVNLLRPETYIQTRIDPEWKPLRQTPPFPAYPSGHAVLGGAVAEVLTAMFGTVAYTDRYGIQYGMAARSYTSFAAAAYENALSRLYAGVHFRVDMENGLSQGRCVGQQVLNALRGES